MSAPRSSEPFGDVEAAHLCATVLRALPDEPRYVEARAMLLRGDAEIFHANPAASAKSTEDLLPDCVIRGIEQPLAVVIGLPGGEIIRESVETARTEIEVLCHESQRTLVASSLPGWNAEGATFHVLAPGATVRDAEARAGVSFCMLEPPDAPMLGALAPRLRQEMLFALRISPVVAAMIDGRPASMVYSPAMTERWFDIAVETVESHQRRGLAELVSRRLITQLMRRGLQPIWGAVDSNAPSLALARKLGFAAHDRLALFTRPHGSGRHNRA